jgi:hypothetical protein
MPYIDAQPDRIACLLSALLTIRIGISMSGSLGVGFSVAGSWLVVFVSLAVGAGTIGAIAPRAARRSARHPRRDPRPVTVASPLRPPPVVAADEPSARHRHPSPRHDGGAAGRASPRAGG